LTLGKDMLKVGDKDVSNQMNVTNNDGRKKKR
jgi:hypothetical protein